MTNDDATPQQGTAPKTDGSAPMAYVWGRDSTIRRVI